MILPNLSKLCIHHRPAKTGVNWVSENVPTEEDDVWNDNCAICTEGLRDETNGRPIIVCTLGHIFHSNCYNNAVSGGMWQCPSCREDLVDRSKTKKPDFVPIYLEDLQNAAVNQPQYPPPESDDESEDEESEDEESEDDEGLTDGQRLARSYDLDDASAQIIDATKQGNYDLLFDIINQQENARQYLNFRYPIGDNDEKETLLMWAERIDGTNQLARLLIKDPRVIVNMPKPDDKNRTVIMLAVMNANVAVVDMLARRRDVDLELTDDLGNAAIHYVQNVDNNGEAIEVLQSLFRNQVDINSRNSEGNTLLHLAAGDCRLVLFRRLIKLGAKTFIKNSAGLTAYEMAEVACELETNPVLKRTWQELLKERE